MAQLRVGVVGRRGLFYAGGIRSVPGVEITAFADLDPVACADAARDHGVANTYPDFHQMLESVDAVVVGTPMHLHASQSLDALALGKPVLSEVTAAVTVDECQALLAADPSAERYMFAENYCYFSENLIMLELVRRGMFGELYFGEGEYVHEVRFLHRHASGEPTWRMDWQVGRPGNTYCTHELGPLMRWFRTYDPTIRIVSVACFGSGTHSDKRLNHEDTTLTLVKLSNGELLKLGLDMVSNRPHRIGYTLQGTLGAYEGFEDKHVYFGPNETRGWGDPERKWGPLSDYEDVLGESLRQEVRSASEHGHGGADYIVGRRFSELLTGQRPPEITVREGVEWTMVGLLSQASILEGSRAIPMPAWVYGDAASS